MASWKTKISALSHLAQILLHLQTSKTLQKYDIHREFLTVLQSSQVTALVRSWLWAPTFRIIHYLDANHLKDNTATATYCTGRKMCAVYVSWLGWEFYRSASIDVPLFDEPPRLPRLLKVYYEARLAKWVKKHPWKAAIYSTKRPPLKTFF